MGRSKFLVLALAILIFAFAEIGEVNAITATGGTITTSGGYTIHTFTTGGTFTVTGSGNVEVLVVAGGGGGGAMAGGGGGAGGLIFNSSYLVSEGQAITATVGAGGSGGITNYNGNNGGVEVNSVNGYNSVFGTLTAIGGGKGGQLTGTGLKASGSGGSGGGAWGNNGGASGTLGQGNVGGQGDPGTSYYNEAPGGGGGAGAVGGTAGYLSTAGNGGSGLAYSISGTSIYYAGGGGGGIASGDSSTTGGTGGSGGGGNGGGRSSPSTVNGGNGVSNRGGGGGGGSYTGQPGTIGVGGNGGSGIIIVKYLTDTSDTTPPTSTLSSPSSGNTTLNTTITFTCSATDNIALSNLTLKIWNASGSQIHSNASSMGGASNSTSWAYTFANVGQYAWNCLAYDNSSNSAYSPSNSTITIAYPPRASGGTVTSILVNGTNYTIHTFTSNGTFIANAPMYIDLLVVAGGGGGGGYSVAGGGGGGAGELLSANSTVTAKTYGIVVGGGGRGGNASTYATGSIGGDSIFDAITAKGGGGGAGENMASQGGSGGGGSALSSATTAGANSSGTGKKGGNGYVNQFGGGGGGQSTAGGNAGQFSAASGGNGISSSISGSSVGYGGGGGGGANGNNGNNGGAGGSGGGGTGLGRYALGTTGTPSTGGGGGGGGNYGYPAQYMSGYNGGSGIVIIRYLTYGTPPTFASNFSSAQGSTNFSAIADLGNITNLTLATQKGKIKFAENHMVNATGQDYDSQVVIGKGFISVNSSALSPTFNNSATLTINNVSCPATVYYASGFFNSSEDVVAQKKICNSTTDPSCTNITCSGGNLTFTVSHFTGFAYGASANLTIWDETDSGMPNGNQMKYISQNIRFFANYSNSSSEPITGANCQIWFSDSGWNSMSWNSTNLYEYTRSFTSGGSFDWNVSCNKSGQATLDANDTVIVNSTIAVVLNSPADNAIVKSSVILYNWSAYGFPGDPTCNLTRNGSVVYSATCTNNALCGYTNTTANGEYIWNVTCNSGATTRESSTRALTVNTLYHSTNVEGTLNMNITEITSISLPQSTISFGTVEITQTYDSYPTQFFVIRNDGNVLVDVEVNATNPFLGSNCTSLPCAAYQVKVGANETIPYPICSGNPSKETYTNMFGSSSGLLINDLNFVDNDDSANVYIKFRLPNDEPPGSKSSTVTFWAKSAGSYACN